VIPKKKKNCLNWRIQHWAARSSAIWYAVGSLVIHLLKEATSEQSTFPSNLSHCLQGRFIMIFYHEERILIEYICPIQCTGCHDSYYMGIFLTSYLCLGIFKRMRNLGQVLESDSRLTKLRCHRKWEKCIIIVTESYPRAF
jgi:hypothetical protein